MSRFVVEIHAIRPLSGPVNRQLVLLDTVTSQRLTIRSLMPDTPETRKLANDLADFLALDEPAQVVYRTFDMKMIETLVETTDNGKAVPEFKDGPERVGVKHEPRTSGHGPR